MPISRRISGQARELEARSVASIKTKMPPKILIILATIIGEVEKIKSSRKRIIVGIRRPDLRTPTNSMDKVSQAKESR